MIKKERRHLPVTRRSITHKAHIGAVCELYLTVGLFEDGTPGELFIVIGKEGSELAGAYDAFGIAVFGEETWGKIKDQVEGKEEKQTGSTFVWRTTSIEFNLVNNILRYAEPCTGFC